MPETPAPRLRGVMLCIICEHERIDVKAPDWTRYTKATMPTMAQMGSASAGVPADMHDELRRGE